MIKDFMCKPANEDEAIEIVKRALANGAEQNEVPIPMAGESYEWDCCECWGVSNGLTSTMSSVRLQLQLLTIDQVRAMLPCEEYDGKPEPEWNGEGLPPVGTDVEVFHEGRWVAAATVGEFGNHEPCMVCAPNGGGFYGFYADAIRPLRSDREKWISEAQKHCTEFSSNQLGKLYDALKSGELKAPEAQ